MNRLFNNCFDFELDLKKPGRTRTKMAIIKTTGIS